MEISQLVVTSVVVSWRGSEVESARVVTRLSVVGNGTMVLPPKVVLVLVLALVLVYELLVEEVDLKGLVLNASPEDVAARAVVPCEVEVQSSPVD